MTELIKHNAAHALAVVNTTGAIPQEGGDHPSVHLSTDAFGNLLVTGVGGVTSNVTVINGAGGGAVNIQDGGNSITVDGTVTEAQTLTVPSHLIKTVAATNTPEALAVNGTLFKTALLIANKAARTANVGDVWLGVTSADGSQPIKLSSASHWTIEAPEGQQYDLNDWYLDVANAGDGVVIIYS